MLMSTLKELLPPTNLSNTTNNSINFVSRNNSFLHHAYSMHRFAWNNFAHRWLTECNCAYTQIDHADVDHFKRTPSLTIAPAELTICVYKSGLSVIITQALTRFQGSCNRHTEVTKWGGGHNYSRKSESLIRSNTGPRWHSVELVRVSTDCVRD